MTEKADILIIGAGIAGASLAARLAQDRSVIVVEMEDRPGYHTTGRSAAMFVPTYGPPAILGLTRASATFFRTPPEGFCDRPLLSPRGEVMLVRPGEAHHIGEAVKLGLKPMALADLKARIAPLKTEALAAAYVEDEAEDIDVDLLHQGFLRQAKRAGAKVICDAAVAGLERTGAMWSVRTRAGDFTASVVVDAAGAWASPVAALGGAQPIHIQPKRRSAALVDYPDGMDASAWPLTFGAGETFYFKPMGGKLMISPADATPVDPHDAWADDMALAEAIDRYQQVMDHEISHVSHTWGGLRCFAPDGDPVVGFDDLAEGFFWLAGQGGYGIQTAPALSRLAAALILDRPVPDDIAAEGITAEQLNPLRFR